MNLKDTKTIFGSFISKTSILADSTSPAGLQKYTSEQIQILNTKIPEILATKINDFSLW